ncbi:MAG: hypothetical protein IJW00_10450 [Clostridia bacterium]|nr:hypothetical protein [Clostridia bacterium]
MYSRSMGPSPYSRMGSREPSYRQSVRIPPNYSGIAIGDPPPDGVSPATDGVVLSEPPLAAEHMGTEKNEMALQQPLTTEENPTKAVAPTDTEPTGVKSFLAQGFPFGHGLGYEELLLLGLILFLLHEGDEKEDEGDLSLTLLLLGALLFFG